MAKIMRMHKIILITLLFVTPVFLSGCSTNTATGKSQFTAFMSPEQEHKIGAQEHQKIAAQFGFYDNPKVVNYVNTIGRKISAKTENPNTQYRFYVLDSPIVNAFALPGGYVYMSRGLLALANSEAEVAAVMAHEIGHVTGRHSAERYSRTAVTGLGAQILSIALDTPGAGDALGLGANLYLSSYSRGQESEADTLGLRYMTRAGYHPDAMAAFLSSLQANSGLTARLDGKKNQGMSYLSTHPATSARVQAAVAQAKQYSQAGTMGMAPHMAAISGITYGDSAEQGFTRGQNFYHPKIGFTFEAPKGFKIANKANEVVASSKDGAAMIFDMAANKGRLDAGTYLKQIWVKNEKLKGFENITINGMKAATGMFSGRINGKPASIRLIAIEFKPESIARFQVALPQGASSELVNSLKTATYSFRKLNQKERTHLKPKRIKIVTARSGDTASSLGRRMPFSNLQEERFRVLNALIPGEALKAGKQYKVVAE